MKEIFVLGIGSRIVMDDGVGVYLTEDLKQLSTNPGIKFISGETDIDYCLSEISKANFVIILDAFLSGKDPGELTVLPLSDLGRENNALYSLHDIHFLNIIQSPEYKLDGILIGIEPYEINYGFSLSNTLQSRYQDILKSVHEHINKYFEQHREGC